MPNRSNATVEHAARLHRRANRILPYKLGRVAESPSSVRYKRIFPVCQCASVSRPVIASLRCHFIRRKRRCYGCIHFTGDKDGREALPLISAAPSAVTDVAQTLLATHTHGRQMFSDERSGRIKSQYPRSAPARSTKMRRCSACPASNT